MPGDDATPPGWREAGREDLWGALAPGAEPWRVHARPSLLRIRAARELRPRPARDRPRPGRGAILVHEAFHGSQLDAAPWLDPAWWMEGPASETDRHLPPEAYCRGARTGDCFEPPTLAGADLARFHSERFPFAWRQPDPSLTMRG